MSTPTILRKVPIVLNHRQRLFVDGIRYSIEMTAVAYARLCAALMSIPKEEGPLPNPDFAPILLDAWSVVDCTHRLRRLLGGMPGLKHSPEQEVFLRETAGVENLRNAVQHLVGEFDANSNGDDLPWGSLRWVEGPWEGALQLSVLIAGALTSTTRPMINPAGQIVRPPIDWVTLDAHGYSLNISETARRVETAKKHLEAGWAKVVAENPQCSMADVITSVQFSSP